MKVLDPGHKYELTSFDGGDPIVLTFVKRNDPLEKYPGNLDAYPGTQSQEVLRALIDRGHYVNGQQPSPANDEVIDSLRWALKLLELRHLRQHGGNARLPFPSPIEVVPFCQRCGHITCFCPP